MGSGTLKIIWIIVIGLFGLGYSLFAWLEAGLGVISFLAFLAAIGIVLFLVSNLTVYLEDRAETDMSPNKYTPWKNHEE